MATTFSVADMAASVGVSSGNSIKLGATSVDSRNTSRTFRSHSVIIRLSDTVYLTPFIDFHALPHVVSQKSGLLNFFDS